MKSFLGVLAFLFASFGAPAGAAVLQVDFEGKIDLLLPSELSSTFSWDDRITGRYVYDTNLAGFDQGSFDRIYNGISELTYWINGFKYTAGTANFGIGNDTNSGTVDAVTISSGIFNSPSFTLSGPSIGDWVPNNGQLAFRDNSASVLDDRDLTSISTLAVLNSFPSRFAQVTFWNPLEGYSVTVRGNIDVTTVSQIPLPAGFPFLLTGLAVLASLRMRNKRTAQA